MLTTPSLTLRVNGVAVQSAVPPSTRLATALRDDLSLQGTKVGCDAGDCGACTVLVDDEIACACLMSCAQAEGREITTIEGLTHACGVTQALQAAFLRHGAAQCGFCTPGMLIAAAALLRRQARPSRREVEDALGGVLCRCTGYGKIVAAVLDASERDTERHHPEEPAQRASRRTHDRDACFETRPSAAPQHDAVRAGRDGVVGARLARLDGPRKVEGSERFGSDVAPEGALLLRVVRAPLHRAAFRFGDLDSYLEAHPGLAAILTARDVPGRNRYGVIPPFADQPAFAETETRFRGEAVAAVVGDAEVIAALDLDAFPVVWEELPAVLGMEEALAPDAPLLHATRPGNVLTRGRVVRGDAVAALAGADVTAEGVFESGFVEHAPIEPEAGFARRVGNRIEIHACTQAPYMDRDDVAILLGIAAEDVRIVPTAVGGGFGTKLDLSVQPFLALAAWTLGEPVRMTYSRPESMRTTTKRHPGRIAIRAGASADGRLVGFDLEGDFNTGAYASWGPTVANRVPVHASGPYYVPHYRALTRAVHTHLVPAGAFRGFGVPQASLAQEQVFDELALKLGIDRLEFRILNALRADQPTVTGQVLGEGVGIRACLEALRPHWARALAEADRWNAKASKPPHAEVLAGGEPRSTQRNTSASFEAPLRGAPQDEERCGKGAHLRRGVGVAGMWYGCGNTSLSNPSTMRIGIRPDGRIALHQGAVDIGQGSNTVIPQIAAEALGAPLAAFDFVSADTDLTPDCGKTSASRQTFVTGKAAELAGRALRADILRLANAGGGARLEFGAGEIRVTDGGPVRTIRLGELPLDQRGYALSVEESFDPPTSPLDEDGQGDPYAVYGFGAHMAEIEVDVTLGTVRVLRITAAHDVGRAINPTLVEGQIEGGIAQGLGLALMEEYHPGRGENLHDYLIPTIGDMPPVLSILVEDPSWVGPFGAKGIGEQALIPTAPAILNAIHDATGARIRRVPATPDRVLAAIKRREEPRHPHAEVLGEAEPRSTQRNTGASFEAPLRGAPQDEERGGMAS